MIGDSNGFNKQQALDADTKAIHQINFTVNLDLAEQNFNVFHY